MSLPAFLQNRKAFLKKVNTQRTKKRVKSIIKSPNGLPILSKLKERKIQKKAPNRVFTLCYYAKRAAIVYIQLIFTCCGCTRFHMKASVSSGID